MHLTSPRVVFRSSFGMFRLPLGRAAAQSRAMFQHRTSAPLMTAGAGRFALRQAAPLRCRVGHRMLAPARPRGVASATLATPILPPVSAAGSAVSSQAVSRWLFGCAVQLATNR